MRSSLGIAFALWAPHLCAQSPSPAHADAGPLLCFTTASPEFPGEHTLHVAAVRAGSSATALWQSREPAHVLQRLDRDHLLLAQHDAPGGLFRVHLVTTARQQLTTGDPARFVAVHGDEVLHLGDGAADGELLATAWRGTASRRRLDTARFARIVTIRGDRAFGLPVGEREVRVVDLRRGKGRPLCPVPDLHDVTVALSPAGDRAAIGGVDAMGHGELAVVQIASATVLRRWRELPIEVDPFSSFVPTVEARFDGDDRVVCSETRREAGMPTGDFVHVTRSIATGACVAERRYAPMGARHAVPEPPTTNEDVPWFSAESLGERQLLRRRGQTEPVQSLPISHWLPRQIWIAPDGRAAITQAVAGGCRLFTLDDLSGHPLSTHRAQDFTWLPAAPK